MGKVPEYTNKAIERYHAKFDRIAASLPKGTKDIINNIIGMSCNAYINKLVSDDLNARGLIPAANTEPEKNDSDCPF